MYKDSFVSVIIAAAGSSRRMGELDKLYMNLGGVPVLAHTARVFECSDIIDEIIISCKEGTVDKCMRQVVIPYGLSKVKAIIPGGGERYESVGKAMELADKNASVIMVHDGARPFVSGNLIKKVTEAAVKNGAAVPCVPIKDTVKSVKEDKELIIEKTLERSCLRAVQTPQAFEARILHKAYSHMKENPEAFKAVTDDASLVEALGYEVVAVEGEEKNIKLTTPSDIKLAEFFYSEERPLTNTVRIGNGYDVHVLVEGRRLVLGGCEIIYEKGLSGHSDADVLLHAIMDAMLGAAAEGDIGRHFPDSDERYKDISSLELLSKTESILTSKGYRVGNIDATVVAEKPRIAPYVERMRANIASVLKISVERINIKGTTTEGLGFTGRGGGIAAYATALILKDKI